MPYLRQDCRDSVENLIRTRGLDYIPLNAGEVNYIVTRLINNSLKFELSYAKINEMIGALECCKLELYRRTAAPYEDMKIKDNGDVN